MSPLVTLAGVDLVFGRRADAAFPLLDAGLGRDEVQRRTGAVVAVQGASLAVEPGELVVLMGLSGSGKSSLLRCVNGLSGRGDAGRLRGRVTLAGVDVSRCSGRQLRALRRSTVAMVFQQFGLLPWRTLIDNVALPLELRGVPAAERVRIARERLALVRLGDWAERKPGELSGGMQQRVGLARAFASEAPLLLMDEPFSALDPLIRRELQDELVSLLRRLKRTILFVSHDLEEALRLGHRVAIMEEGRILQVGAPREIVVSPACEAVRRFVAHANPLSVLTAGCVMAPLGAPAAETPAAGTPAPGAPAVPEAMVPSGMPALEAVARLNAAGRALIVVEGGVPVGTLSSGDILRRLVPAPVP